MKIFVIWAVTLYDLVHRCKRFGGTCCLHLQGKKDSSALKMDMRAVLCLKYCDMWTHFQVLLYFFILLSGVRNKETWG
jgi:hypothetical protein